MILKKRGHQDVPSPPAFIREFCGSNLDPAVSKVRSSLSPKPSSCIENSVFCRLRHSSHLSAPAALSASPGLLTSCREVKGTSYPSMYFTSECPWHFSGCPHEQDCCGVLECAFVLLRYFLPCHSFLILHGLKATIWCKAGKDTARTQWPQDCPPGLRETVLTQKASQSLLPAIEDLTFCVGPSSPSREPTCF